MDALMNIDGKIRVIVGMPNNSILVVSDSGEGQRKPYETIEQYAERLIREDRVMLIEDVNMIG
jgi:hypothetical protein